MDELFDVTGDGAVVLRVHVQPGAGRSGVVGRQGEALKVRVAAPPVEGRANDACVAQLADTFGVAPSDIALTSGEASRAKRFRIEGVELDAFRRLLERALEGERRPGRTPRPR